MKVKICGLREHSNVMELSALDPAWMGFIFYQGSKRYIYNAEQFINLQLLKKTIKRVGVFVNESAERIQQLQAQFELDLIQLHGDEDPAYCSILAAKGLKLIKAFQIAGSDDFEKVEAFAPYVEYFLFDTKGDLPGGNGKQFNWSLLIERRFSKPFLLSGGIAPDMAAELNSFKHPDCEGVDINSRFEDAPGLKNVLLTKTFIQQLS
jgi:phosphoribosylanthranilate isomerase